MTEFTQTERTTLKRIPKRGDYKKDVVYKILDEGFVCHIGFIINGSPCVIPTGYARQGDRLIFHGSTASRMMRSLSEGIDVCITVTLIDGIVLARSAFHHSFNYRSVVMFGRATLITDKEEKMSALEAFTEHIMLGRWSEVRIPNEQELKATSVLALPLAEVSAKVRTGQPIDDEEDYQIPVWAGVLPLQLATRELIADERNIGDIPDYLYKYMDRNKIT
ncbi:MAG: pyridoxamine 5'-phosphate oxidase family protein [Blastocatellia bacterium]